jgi:hydrogenase/urease accessory protein HupE
LSAVPSLDSNGDGTLTADELEQGHDRVDASIAQAIVVRGDGAPCAGALATTALTDEDGLQVVSHYTCPAVSSKITIDLGVLASFSRGHRHMARATSGASVIEGVLLRARPTLEVPAAGAAATTPPPARGLAAFVRMGIEHILTGYDHLLFLVGLVLVGGRLRSLLGVITAFTVAHSITLGLAVLGVVAPSSRFVEPAIALSIAYVGVENFFVRDAAKRWRLTLPFGLVHGFGFAGALREIDLPRVEVPSALLGFNVGVELGQLAVLAVLLPLLALLRRREGFGTRGVRVLSGCIVAAGVVWFVQRIVAPA